MLDKLLNYAKENMGNIIDGIPELQQTDKQKTVNVLSSSVLNEVMKQIKDGNFSGIKEMLSGETTPLDHEEVKKLEEPVTEDVKNKLGLSKNTASVLALAVIPIILNMLNKKVNEAKANGVDINGSLSKMETDNSIVPRILKLFGAKNLNRTGILEQLIKRIL